jgi:hypothetical protein
MAFIDPICTPFVVQIGPIPATIDPESGLKTLQNLKVLLKISGTELKTRVKRPFFNNFPVP